MEFSTSFVFVQIGVENTAGAKHQKMRMVPNGKKNNVFLDFAVLCGSADSSRLCVSASALNFLILLSSMPLSSSGSS